MTAAHDLTDLVQLSSTLGEPWRRFAILAEGNTSQRVAEDQLAVKATGRSLRHASAEDFVMVSLRRLSDIVDDSEAGDAEVAHYFDEVENEQACAPRWRPCCTLCVSWTPVPRRWPTLTRSP